MVNLHIQSLSKDQKHNKCLLTALVCSRVDTGVVQTTLSGHTTDKGCGWRTGEAPDWGGLSAAAHASSFPPTGLEEPPPSSSCRNPRRLHKFNCCRWGGWGRGLWAASLQSYCSKCKVWLLYKQAPSGWRCRRFLWPFVTVCRPLLDGDATT